MMDESKKVRLGKKAVVAVAIRHAAARTTRPHLLNDSAQGCSWTFERGWQEETAREPHPLPSSPKPLSDAQGAMQNFHNEFITSAQSTDCGNSIWDLTPGGLHQTGGRSCSSWHTANLPASLHGCVTRTLKSDSTTVLPLIEVKYMPRQQPQNTPRKLAASCQHRVNTHVPFLCLLGFSTNLNIGWA